MRHCPYHDIFRVVRFTGPVPDITVTKLFCAVLIDRQCFYMQAVARKVKASIRYLIALAQVDVVIGFSLFLFLLIRIV